MRPPELAKPLTLFLLSCTLGALPAQAVAAAHAPSKLRLCHPCEMPVLPVVLPHQGIVLSYGSIFSEVSTWYLVDLERAEATRILASVDRRTRKLSVVEKVTRPLLPEELSEVTQLADRIWASNVALPTRIATDVVWDLWLLDAGQVRREFGPGVPDGLADELAKTMERLVGGK